MDLPVVSDCDGAIRIASSSADSDVTAGDIITITCSITCSVPQTLMLYKNRPSPEVVGTSGTGQAIPFTAQREDNAVAFYCDVDGWLTDVESREIYFNVQCKCYKFKPD